MKINDQGNLVLSQSKADNVSDCVTLDGYDSSAVVLTRDTLPEFKSGHQTVSTLGFLPSLHS